MLHGDISNQAGYTIAFRCEDFLLKIKDSTFKDRALNLVFGKFKRAEIDQTVKAVMEFLYRQTEYCVDLVVDRENYTADLKQIIDDLPFGRVVVVDKVTQISTRLLTGDITYYVDDDSERRSLVNSEYAISLSKLHDFIKMKRM